jgi:hypothetical protein
VTGSASAGALPEAGGLRQRVLLLGKAGRTVNGDLVIVDRRVEVAGHLEQMTAHRVQGMMLRLARLLGRRHVLAPAL